MRSVLHRSSVACHYHCEKRALRATTPSSTPMNRSHNQDNGPGQLHRTLCTRLCAFRVKARSVIKLLNRQPVHQLCSMAQNPPRPYWWRQSNQPWKRNTCWEDRLHLQTKCLLQSFRSVLLAAATTLLGAWFLSPGGEQA